MTLVRGNSAIVTGASTGIGRACALALAERGWHVYAGVRGDPAAANVRVAGITPVPLDITDPEQIADVARRVADETDGLTGLVNNAGTTTPCPVEYLPVDEFRDQLAVNLVGHYAVTKAFLPLLRRPGGRIVAISSPGAKIAAPFMAPYVAAKAGLEGLCAVLRTELRPAGIHVSIVEPGFVSTDMRKKLTRDTGTVLARLPAEGAARYGPALRAVMGNVAAEAARGAPPDVVARVIVRALTERRPRTRYPAGPGARRILLMARLLPDPLLDRLTARMLRLPPPFGRRR